MKTTDEDNKVAYEFTDKLGRVILRRQMDGTEQYDTYSVYDDFGRLRFVLSPMASDALAAAATTTYSPASNADLKNYAYSYKYNSRGLCIERKWPGADPAYWVYDKADRLIFSQDGEQRPTNSWTFYKVDDLTLNYNGNQLKDATDAIPAATSTIGFVKPATTVSNPVVYNANGAMKQNYYNGIAGISYNALNLPEKIRFLYGHATQYSYEASGVKRRVVHQTVKTNLNIPLETTNYAPAIRTFNRP